MTMFRLSQLSLAALSSWACSLRGIFTENVTRSLVFGRPTGRLDFDMFSPDRERGNLGNTYIIGFSLAINVFGNRVLLGRLAA